MSNTTHTPGPWEADYYPLSVSFFNQTYKRKRLYRYMFGVEFAENMPEAERRANARLIAAAPDLLQAAERALQALQHNYDKYDNCKRHDTDQTDAYIALRAAISRTKGGNV